MGRGRIVWGIVVLVLVGCPSSDDDRGRTGAAGTAGAAGTGSGTAGAGPGAGAVAGTSGAAGTGAGTSAPAGTGAGAAGTHASAGTSAAGGGGRGGATAGAGSGGSGGGGGTSGTSGCTQNIACKLTALASTGDIRQDCVDRINQFRTECACLTPLARWTEAESCADTMAEHDSMTGMAHSGFTGKVCSPGGNGQNECPGYRSESSVISTCLQQMWSEGPPPTTPCNGDCFQKYGHFINMTNPKFKKVACGFFETSSGSVWAVQNFSP